MILGRKGTYRAFGAAKAGGVWISVYREFSSTNGGALNIGVGQSRDIERIFAVLRASTNALVTCGWEVIPLTVLRAQLGAGDSFSPYAGFVPMPTEHGQVDKLLATTKARQIAEQLKAKAKAEAETAEAIARKQAAALESQKRAIERAKLEQAAELMPLSTGAALFVVPVREDPTRAAVEAAKERLKKEAEEKKKRDEELESRGINPDTVDRFKNLELD